MVAAVVSCGDLGLLDATHPRKSANFSMWGVMAQVNVVGEYLVDYSILLITRDFQIAWPITWFNQVVNQIWTWGLHPDTEL